MKKIIRTTLAIGVMTMVIITGCRKDTTVIIKPVPVEVTDTVSFTKDLVPLFTKNCALSGCHANGSKAPILSVDKAYNSLINGNYVDIDAPESSIIYKRLTGQLTPAMPMGASPNPSNINGLILAWIKQGANKN